MGWDLLTRSRLNIEDVIRVKRVYYEISDRAVTRSFVAWLRLDEMRMRDSREPGDARLVIEVIDDAGETTTFYADKGWLYSADSSSWRAIDDEFRERFSCFLAGGTAP